MKRPRSPTSYAILWDEDMVRPSDTVVIAFCDATRPVPNEQILPVVAFYL